MCKIGSALSSDFRCSKERWVILTIGLLLKFNKLKIHEKGRHGIKEAAVEYI